MLEAGGKESREEGRSEVWREEGGVKAGLNK
jgi:hypothetical protein